MSKRIVLALSLSLSLFACDDPPTTVELKSPGTLKSSAEFALDPKVKGKSGKELPDVKPTLEVQPKELAAVSSSNTLRCLKSGDGVLKVTAGSLTRDEPFKCRIVDSIRGPRELRLVLPGDAVPAEIVVLDSDGKAMTDVDVRLQIDRPNVATAEGTRLKPVSVGTTRINVFAGDKTMAFAASVVRTIENKQLALKDGEQVSIPLNQGRYQVELKVDPAAAAEQGLSLQWVGGSAECQKVDESQDINSRCSIEGSGSLIVANPKNKGKAPPVNGVLALYEAP